MVIALLNGEPGLVKRFDEADEILLPIPVLGELHYGALHSGQATANLSKVEGLAQDCRLIRCDEMVARRYAEVKLELRRKGHPIPENDVWIAACALVSGIPLVSRDTHFDMVEALQRESW